jgi:hypothetical protein
MAMTRTEKKYSANMWVALANAVACIWHPEMWPIVIVFLTAAAHHGAKQIAIDIVEYRLQRMKEIE